MGSGGVAIAALPTVICLKVPFSDGLGGDFLCKKKMKGEQMMMTNKKIKINGCTPIEDLITEDFGAIGTPERDEFERGCEAFIIWDEK